MVFNSEQKINRSRIGEGIYLLYFAFMMGARSAGLYEGMPVYNVILVFSLGLFALKMIITEHTLKEYFLVALLLLLAGLVYINTGEKGLIVCFSMLLGMKAVSVRKVISTGTVVAGVIIFLKIFLGVFGLAPEIYYPQERAGVGLMFRHALGYAHPNTLHMNVLMLSMLVMYLVTKKLRTDEFLDRKKKIFYLAGFSLLVLAFNIYIYQYSGSRTGLLACIAFLFVNFWFFARKNLGLVERIVSYGAFPLACFIAIPLPFILQGELFDFVNRTIFTTRFSLARYFWSNNHISLFGIRLNNPDVTLTGYGIDMAQLYLFLQLGIAAFVVIALLTCLYVYLGIKFELREELAVLMGMLFLGIWEPLLYNLSFKNFYFVFMGAMLFAALTGDESFLEKETGISESVQKTLPGISGALSMKNIVRAFIAAIFIGIAASLIYVAATKDPDALYGNRQESESGTEFGLEPMYISQEQMEDILEDGDLVIGYSGESVAMYRYDNEIADLEYDKRILSAGVWTGILGFVLVMAGTVVTFRAKSKNTQ